MEDVDIHLDSGRYLQEYVASLENLPSEIAYHWAEIQNRNNQCQALERRIQLQQQDLTKIHRQWFQPDADKKEKLLRQEPSIIRRIQRDYEKLSELSTERIQLAEEALRLVSFLAKN
ncbi:uncharacterized protein BYT42DRAFT_108600 [Radiomyces spectabilis]|uniref:uncharacterized protein n=1 Tax=Radiomyces spectabilis TaxID=64574 RepID=UPI00221E52C3|nr:uncharacterized protein BYT42DRAFT_108600 [Radiomyces spectabilis]KAI8369402.1 hypothetical protein BYT42DRAFT_108600 [Radiomyces spectabilis]